MLGRICGWCLVVAIGLIFKNNAVHAQSTSGSCASMSYLCSSTTQTFDFLSQSVDCGGTDGFCDRVSSWSCFRPSNTIWFGFTSTAQGNAQINFTGDDLGSIQWVLVSAANACDTTSYAGIDCAESLSDDGKSIVSIPDANTTYYLMLNYTGTSPESVYSISISGQAVKWSSQIANDQLLCANDNNGQLEITSNQDMTGWEFLWSDPAHQELAIATDLSEGIYEVSVTNDYQCDTVLQAEVTAPEPFTYTTQATDANCPADDGTAQISTAENGLTFDWLNATNVNSTANSSTASTLSAGTYVVIITGDQDGNACTDTAYINISESGGPAVQSDVQNALCYGDPSGEIRTYTNAASQWNWSNGGNTDVVTGLGAGDYFVTITETESGNACSTVLQFEVEEPERLVAELTTASASCGMLDGTALVSLVGGTLPAAGYNWRNLTTNTSLASTAASVQGLSAGDYRLDVLDANSCQTSELFTIGSRAADFQMDVDVASEGCGGVLGSITINSVDGGTPDYFYGIDPNSMGDGNYIGNLTAGDYTLYVRDGQGCEVNRSIQILPPDAPTVTLDFETAPVCGDEWTVVAILDGGTPPFEYSFNGLPTQADNSFSDVLVDTSVTVRVFYAGNCTLPASATEPLSVDDPCGTLDPEEQFSPNGDGTADTWRIQDSHLFPNIDLKVFDRWGQVVHHQSGVYENWDGTTLGGDVPDGVYYYVLFKDADNRDAGVLKRTVLIVR